MYISFGLKKFLAPLPGIDNIPLVIMAKIWCIHILVNKFLASLMGKDMINLKINILTKKGFTNLDIFLFDIIFQKITKTVLIAVVEEATDIFL